MAHAGPPTKQIERKLKPVEDALARAALAYPGTTEEYPWGHRTAKVNGKAFIFMGMDENGFGLSVKLPHSAELALNLPFATPTGYGLGKSGWVSAKFTAADDPPLPMLLEWLDESYRAVAPKRLVAQLAAGAGAGAGAKAGAGAGAKAGAVAKAGAGAKAGVRAGAKAGAGKKSAAPAKKATAVKATAKKAIAEKAPAKKAVARKATAKKATAKRAG